ncbi:hypothetical protein FXN63_25660 [Pigmentiphaga aceris]|uniref:Uncharacterized protein n=1 Tax=Pigmentiphaga aceris TaxID=1940612 RepID=A0A5C0B755_9BURK|nr:hypothetical protein [Pigmentiphaga aceris]QEI08861.1 hypothetical protein FXN63_25660 [Pigmentiphaga aceris]
MTHTHASDVFDTVDAPEAPLEPLLRHCSTADLLREEPYRQYKLGKERRAKKLNLLALGSVAIAIFCTGIWNWSTEGMTDLSVILTAFGFMLGLAALKRHEMPSEGEEMQMYVLREIEWLLRERGVR